MTTPAKNRIPLADAQLIADDLIDEFEPFCQIIQVAGSVRRQRHTVGDLELVCIPKFGRVFEPDGYSIFGGEHLENENLQIRHVIDLIETGTFQHRLSKTNVAACGERFQRLLYQGTPLDVFCCLPPAQWGCILTLRTGPTQFNRWLVTPNPAGALPNSIIMDAGSLWYGRRDRQGEIEYKGSQIETPTEESFFEALRIPWVEPNQRDHFIQSLIDQGKWKEK